MKKILLNGFHLNYDYTLKLVEDVPDERMTEQPGSFTNHPKWTLGHLVTASALTAEDLGASYQVPSGWDDLFLRRGPGDPRLPETDPSKYPHKDKLLAALEEKYQQVVCLIETAENDKLSQVLEWKLDHYMPSVADVIFFQCHIHHAWHIGQLAEWRRLMGYDSALAKLLRN